MLDLSGNQHEALQAVTAIGRWGAIPETRPMVDWIRAELARLDRANRSEQDETILRQQQGAAKALEDILRLADEAGEKAGAIQNSIQRKGVGR
jgi:hypothetical protein